MSVTPRTRILKYRRHRPSGLAVVTLGARDIDLGKHGSPEGQAESRRLIGEWLTAGGPPVVTSPLAPSSGAAGCRT